MEEYEMEDNATVTDIPVINSTVEKVLSVLLSTTQQPLHSGKTTASAVIGAMVPIAVAVIAWFVLSRKYRNRSGPASAVTYSGGISVTGAFGAETTASMAQTYISSSAAVKDNSEPVLLRQSPREDLELQGGPSSSQQGGPSSSQAPLLETESNLPQSDSRPDGEDEPVENVQHSSYPEKDGNFVKPPPNNALAIDGSPPPAYKSRPDSMASRKPSLSSDERSTRGGQVDRHTSISTDGEDFPKSTSLPCAEEKPSRKVKEYIDPEVLYNFISAPPSCTVGDPPAYTPSPTSSFDLFSKNSTRYRRSSSNSDSEQPLLNQSYNTSNNTSQFNHDRNNKNGHI